MVAGVPLGQGGDSRKSLVVATLEHQDPDELDVDVRKVPRAEIARLEEFRLRFLETAVSHEHDGEIRPPGRRERVACHTSALELDLALGVAIRPEDPALRLRVGGRFLVQQGCRPEVLACLLEITGLEMELGQSVVGVWRARVERQRPLRRSLLLCACDRSAHLAAVSQQAVCPGKRCPGPRVVGVDFERPLVVVQAACNGAR